MRSMYLGYEKEVKAEGAAGESEALRGQPGGQHRAQEPGGSQGILAEIFGARPGDVGDMLDSQKAAGEKKVGLIGA
jgi:hypothetical protein